MSIVYIRKATPEQPPQGGRLGRAAPGRTARAGGPRADGGDGGGDGGRTPRHHQTPPHHAQGFHTPFGQPLTPIIQ